MTRSGKVEHENVEEDVFVNQIEALQEDENFEIETEEEAERLFTDVQTEIMLKSQDAGRDWTHDQISALTHYTIGLNRVGQDQLPSGKKFMLARWGPRFIAFTMWTLAANQYLNDGSLLVVFWLSVTAMYVWLTGI